MLAVDLYCLGIRNAMARLDSQRDGHDAREHSPMLPEQADALRPVRRRRRFHAAFVEGIENELAFHSMLLAATAP